MMTRHRQAKAPKKKSCDDEKEEEEEEEVSLLSVYSSRKQLAEVEGA